MKFADLHLHTLFSDSTYTPQDLVSGSASCGLSAIAVVDHDTVDGIEPTCAFAKTKNIEVIEGIELSADYLGREVHILGYLIDYKRKGLRRKLDSLKKDRVERIYKMVDKLKGMGIALDAQDIFELAKQGTVGRLHVARAMVKKGVVASAQEAFRKYIGDKCPAYVLGFRFSVPEAIKLIRDVNGIPVLAHPYVIGDNGAIPEFVNAGLMGLEVYYPEHTAAMVNTYLGLARKHNLLVTGGSDCHGNAKPEIKLGSIKIPYRLVEDLRVAKGKR